MTAHGPDKLIVVESRRQSENRVERENPNFVLMVPVGRFRSLVKTGDFVSLTLTYQAILPLNEARIGTARVLGKSIQSQVYIGDEPVNPAETAHRNRVIVLHNESETLGALWKTGPRNRK